MLLSFSVPEMLPMVVRSLRSRDGLDAGVDDWLNAHFEHEISVGLSGQKSQTIRQYDPQDPKRQWWLKASAGTRLQIWWLSPRVKFKNPTGRQIPKRLGEVSVVARDTVLMRNRDGKFQYIDRRGEQNPCPMARMDGFRTFSAMRDYFVPRPGDQFHGVLVRW